MDLITLARIVTLEIFIREQWAKLQEEGVIMINARGTQIANPRFNVYDQSVRQQAALIRSMSLNATESDYRTVAKSARQEEAAAKIIKDKGAESLLAMPN